VNMKALVYEAPGQMAMREIPIPDIQPDEVLIRVAYSGICGSELSGFLGQNELRKPPTIFGHEFSGTIEKLGAAVGASYPELSTGARVTANPFVTCGRCEYCLSGRQNICPNRRLMSAHIPGSNAEFIAVPARNVYPLPDMLDLSAASLAEPAACAIHAVRLTGTDFGESAYVVGAGTIGLLVIETLVDLGVKNIYVSDLNADRMAMAAALGAKPLPEGAQVDVSYEAVGVTATRAGCIRATRSGGRVAFIGNHEIDSNLPVNDMVRREIACYGSYAYNPLDFQAALDGLADGRFGFQGAWTRVEPLENGQGCFEELLRGAPVAKIWLTPAK
jgi:2-desacetyl-2-hydroxyethyl bacteriochlorophyllide A dehydrogenase